ncbi:MAG TPA: tetratricopeptide repeat protein [Rhodothermales bacterium]|nr:tetratricopeptide repeat protein [Rhodothermales bacterium]
MKPIILFLCLCWFGLTGCTDPDPAPDTTEQAATEEPEAVSLLGEPLYRQNFPPEQRAKLEANLDTALTNYEQNPNDVENVIWLGRRQAYLWRYQEAIDTFSEGIAQFPDEPKLYRHRGHRYITVRNFDRAVADLQHAADLIEGTEDEIEPDGAPNPAGIPTSTLHTNIWYHLGLAHYLMGNYEDALAAYQQCLAASTNDDMRVATLDWLYMTLHRLDRPEEAQTLLTSIHADMELLESFAYHHRLLMYKGEIPPDSLLHADPTADDRALQLATQGYGVGNWYLANGDSAKAEAIFREVIDGSYWPAFGYIAAESDLQRME